MRRWPANAVSPHTGESLTWFRCGVHGDVALGSPKGTPHHCQGVWSDPEMRDCGEWAPADDATAARKTLVAAR